MPHYCLKNHLNGYLISFVSAVSRTLRQKLLIRFFLAQTALSALAKQASALSIEPLPFAHDGQ